MSRPKDDFKISYSTMTMDAEAFHAAFDRARAEAQSGFGASHANYVNGAARTRGEPWLDRSPIDRELVVGRFVLGTRADARDAIAAARAAFPAWRDLGWRARVEILRRAADLLRERKYSIAAMMAYEVGKNRLESMGDVEESADLIAYYASEMERHDGFELPMGHLGPNEDTKTVLRPFGVFAVISPFNFPLALATGMCAGALLGGNAVVFKPASDAPWCGLALYRALVDAGVPAGVVHILVGRGSEVGDELARNPGVDGMVFTGSREVGAALVRLFAEGRYPRPCIIEMGGKNPAIVTARADLEKATSGVLRSAFGYGGQKCSACSRLFVHRDVADELLERFVIETGKLRIGDPTERDVFLGPLINEAAARTYRAAVERARADGRILTGGRVLDAPPLDRGYFVEPVIAELPADHELFREELFVPFLCVDRVRSLDEALDKANAVEYGLTAGVFSEDAAEVEEFFRRIEAGVTYVNRQAGATTGAWPGVQSFTGWKASGSSGKGVCGPYYVQQFMREQSRTVMR
ncbi:MAG: aldehyde dehydrogenase family protein [Gemmatimonadota bacterium]